MIWCIYMNGFFFSRFVDMPFCIPNFVDDQVESWGCGVRYRYFCSWMILYDLWWSTCYCSPCLLDGDVKPMVGWFSLEVFAPANIISRIISCVELEKQGLFFCKLCGLDHHILVKWHPNELISHSEKYVTPVLFDSFGSFPKPRQWHSRLHARDFIYLNNIQVNRPKLVVQQVAWLLCRFCTVRKLLLEDWFHWTDACARCSTDRKSVV